MDAAASSPATAAVPAVIYIFRAAKSGYSSDPVSATRRV